jgi:hypothetical protein
MIGRLRPRRAQVRVEQARERGVEVAISFVAAGIRIASMHGRAHADTSERVTVRAMPNGTSWSVTWFCTNGWLSVGSDVALPSSATTLTGSPTGASALRRHAARIARFSAARSASSDTRQSASRAVVSASRRGSPTRRRAAGDNASVSCSVSHRAPAPSHHPDKRRPQYLAERPPPLPRPRVGRTSCARAAPGPPAAQPRGRTGAAGDSPLTPAKHAWPCRGGGRSRPVMLSFVQLGLFSPTLAELRCVMCILVDDDSFPER